MLPLQRLEWLMSQVPPLELAARLRLEALRRFSRRWQPAVPPDIQSRRVFKALALGDALRGAFETAGLTRPCVDEAESVLRGEFALFGGFPVTAPGGTPDWLAAFPEGQRWADCYSFDIDVSGRDGRDIRFTWELSRHAGLVALARAAFLAGDARFASRLEALLGDWMNANLLLRGPNWISPLEVAVRAIAWAFIDDAAADAFSDEFTRRRMRETLFLHGLHIERFLSTGLNPSNHIIGEAAGLFVLGTKFGGTDEGRRWRARAVRVLSDEVLRQTFDSGASREQSIAYHRFVTSLAGLCLAIGGADAFPARFVGRLRLMYEFLASVARPDGTFPSIGDSDDAIALRLSAPKPNDLSGDLALGAALFPDLHLHSGPPSPEALWLIGPRVAAVSEAARGRRPSHIFAGPDLAVLRAPDAKLQLEFDAGPQGYAPVSSHGHADALSVTLWRGSGRLVDPGTYRYNGADSWRDAFRSTAFHSTVIVDGLSQAVPVSAFRWLTLANARLDGHFLSDDLDWARGMLPTGPLRPWTHSRDVIRLGDAVVIVIDTISCRGLHKAEAHFHLGRANVESKGRRAEATYPDGAQTSLFAANADAALDVVGQSILPAPAWCSPHYGAKEPSATIIGAADFEDSIVLPWVISFDSGAVKRSPTVFRAGYAVEMAVGDARYLLVVPPKTDVVHVNSLRFIGRWALVELSGRKFTRAWAADAWALEYAGKRLFTQLGGKAFVEVRP